MTAMLLRKDQLEASLHEEKKLIEDGKLKEDNPLDLSENFNKLCEACRRGDLKLCQEMITAGVNINARDRFDYTPLILVIASSTLLHLCQAHLLICDSARLVCAVITKWYSCSSSLVLYVKEILFKGRDACTMR